jgi:hypothetical protein
MVCNIIRRMDKYEFFEAINNNLEYND